MSSQLFNVYLPKSELLGFNFGVQVAKQRIQKIRYSVFVKLLEIIK
jgi:hypothetical protein